MTGAGKDATVRYKVRANEKGAFRVVRKPFLTPTGGMVGDLHHFLYVVEAAQTPAHVTLQLPTDWNIATSLASKVSGRNLRPFFAAYVRRANKLNVARYLAMTGLQMEMKASKASAPDGTLKPDTRIYALFPNGESKLRLYLTHPRSAWLRAGLRNGDQLVSVNGADVETEGEFNNLLNALHVGDQVKLDVIRVGKPLSVTVEIESYNWPDVKLSQFPAASQRQQMILASWQAGQ